MILFDTSAHGSAEVLLKNGWTINTRWAISIGKIFSAILKQITGPTYIIQNHWIRRRFKYVFFVFSQHCFCGWLWTWCRHQMEIFSALLLHFVGNSPVTGERSPSPKKGGPLKQFHLLYNGSFHTGRTASIYWSYPTKPKFIKNFDNNEIFWCKLCYPIYY